MAITSGSLPDANDVRNLFTGHGNVSVGIGGKIFIPYEIDNASGVRNIHLWVWGKVAGADATHMAHGVSRHYHGPLELYEVAGNDRVSGTGASPGWATGRVRVNGGDSSAQHIGPSGSSIAIASAAVPKFITIYTDGTNQTAVIGDPNSKGATMYTAGSGWGVDGTTVWNTGKMNITAAVTATAGDHYVELVETGNVGGTLAWMIRVEGW